MAYFTCENKSCGKQFWNKHSTARFCSRRCSAKSTSKISNYRKACWYTDEFLLENLRQIAAKVGRTPNGSSLKSPEVSVYKKRFGSYNNAVIKAGLTPNLSCPPSFLENERNEVPLKLRFKILQRDNFRCSYCGGTPNDGFVLHVDHIVPRSKGGKSSEDNLKTSCNICNLGKSDGALV